MRMQEKIAIPVGVLGVSVFLSLLTTTIGQTTSGEECQRNIISRYCTNFKQSPFRNIKKQPLYFYKGLADVEVNTTDVPGNI